MAQAPEHPGDLTASDVFSTGVWSARGGKQALGVDIACTKISIDLQNMRRGQVCIRDSLNSLRDSCGVDTAFVWLFGADAGTIDEVYAAHGALAQCRVEAWRGATLETYPWLKGRLEHLRLSEIRDTAAPRKDQAAEGRRLAELSIGSVLLIAIRVQGQPAGILGLANALPRGAWDVNRQLLLKLLGNSMGAGLERLRIEGRLHKLEERLELAQGAANDGLWDFDIESNEVHFSPRWKQMLGYPVDAQLDSPDCRTALIYIMPSLQDVAIACVKLLCISILVVWILRKLQRFHRIFKLLVYMNFALHVVFAVGLALGGIKQILIPVPPSQSTATSTVSQSMCDYPVSDTIQIRANSYYWYQPSEQEDGFASYFEHSRFAVSLDKGGTWHEFMILFDVCQSNWNVIKTGYYDDHFFWLWTESWMLFTHDGGISWQFGVISDNSLAQRGTITDVAFETSQAGQLEIQSQEWDSNNHLAEVVDYLTTIDGGMTWQVSPSEAAKVTR